MHMNESGWGGWGRGVEGGRSRGFLLRRLCGGPGGISGPEPQCHIPLSGYTSSLVVNLTPFPPNTGPQTGGKEEGADRERRSMWRDEFPEG